MRARGPSLSSVSPSIWVRQSPKAHLLEIFWLARFYFSPLTKLLSSNFHMVVEKLENAFLFLVVPSQAVPPSRLLCWNTLICTRVGVQHAHLSFCVLGAPTSHSGQLDVSLAHHPGLAGSRFPPPRGAACLLWPGRAPSRSRLRPGLLIKGRVGSRASEPFTPGTGIQGSQAFPVI